jgi:two-component system response regulator NreC
VRAAAAGETYINPRLGARMAAEVDTGPPDELTPREIEILGFVARGYMNPEIAEQLVLSVRTVETHRANIQRKTGLTTRAELVAYALEHGLVER